MIRALVWLVLLPLRVLLLPLKLFRSLTRPRRMRNRIRRLARGKGLRVGGLGTFGAGVAAGAVLSEVARKAREDRHPAT